MFRFGVDEGLHAEADAVDTAFGHRSEGRVVKLAGSALDGDFSVGQSDEFAAYGGKEAADEIGGQKRRRSATEINSVDDFGECGVPLRGLFTNGVEVIFQAGDVLIEIAAG